MRLIGPELETLASDQRLGSRDDERVSAFEILSLILDHRRRHVQSVAVTIRQRSG
jgi:hypothetical protein